MTRAEAITRATTWMRALFIRPAVGFAPPMAHLSNGGTEHVTHVTPEVLDTPPTPAEVEQALHWLHGTRHTRRKFERARFHITYRQRDEVAHVLVRLARAYEERSDER